MTRPVPPPGPGDWTLLQDMFGRQMWQQDETAAPGEAVTRFVLVNPPETLVYDDFDEAEAMFEALNGDPAGPPGVDHDG